MNASTPKRRLGWLVILAVLSILVTLSTPIISFGQTCAYRIMPLGDSITSGVGSSDLAGYRKVLYDLLNQNTDYAFDLVGSLIGGPATFDFDHEGHGGYSAAQIASGTYTWLKDNPAEIILLHAGTNRLTTSTAAVEDILDEIDRFSPDTWVVLALIINRNPYSATTSTFNDNLLAMALNRIANGDKIIVVDQENALIYPDDMADLLHPNDQGYFKMAWVWAEGVEPLLDDLCSSAPHIVTSVVSPSTKARINELYTYTVRAFGDPNNYFELVESPSGMTIDAATGLIQWVPSQAGAFEVTVQVSNSFGADSQSFTLVVSDASNEWIIDNGDPGTLASGAWPVSNAVGAYGTDSLYSKTVSGTYTFSAERSGLQDVYLWWTEYSNRSSNVPVRIYDGSTLLATVNVNQTANGGQWNLLGSYSFSGVAQVVVVSTSSSLTTCADAARFVSADTTTPAISSLPNVSGSVGTPYTYSVTAVGDPVLVYALTTAPSGMTIDAATGLIQWVPSQAGAFEVTVQVSNSFGADSQSFTLVVSDASNEWVIDNGDPGTLASGVWPVSNAVGAYGADSLYSKTVSGTYTFSAERSGLQDVYLWWTEYSNRSSNVPVRIYDGSTLLATVNVNQTANGGQWNLLGSYSFSGVAKVVVVSTSSSLTTCADAARFVSADTTTPVISSLPNVSGSVGTPYTYSVTAVGDPVLVYALTAAPSEMTIYAATGLIQWVPSQAGAFEVTVQVSNSFGADSQSFTLVVSDASNEWIIDNGDPGTLASGAWPVSNAVGAYGADSLYSKTLSATYTFSAERSGLQDVYLWWTEYSNRSSKVPVRIYDGSTLLATVNVNQTANGGQWNLLGSYSFSGVAQVVIVSTSRTLTSCADAVKFMPVQ